MTKLEMMIFIKKVAGLDIGEEQAQMGEQDAETGSGGEKLVGEASSPTLVRSDR